MGCNSSKHACSEDNWKYRGGHELEPHFAHIDLIDAAWLLDLANRKVMPERNGVVPPWQLVPGTAKVSLGKLRRSGMLSGLPVGVLSYGWAAKDHPDPSGALLRHLKPVLEAMVRSCKHGIYRGSDDKPEVWGIFWDFLSLPQRGYTSGYDADADDRTPDELARFRSGLKSINFLYGAPYTYTLVCDWPMPPGAENTASLEARGWCQFERCLSSVRKDGNCCLALSRLPTDKAELDMKDIAWACKVGRWPPPRPDDFETTLRDGMTSGAVRFTNGKDATEICIPQYREAFLRLMGAGGDMKFNVCGWTDADVQQLAAALKYAHTAGVPTQAYNLDLGGNRLTAAALPPLLGAIATGAMPQLQFFNLGGNELGDEGSAVFAAALAEGQLPTTIRSVFLSYTGMGDAGAAALARSLGGAPTLETLTLSLQGNAFGQAAKAELEAACVQNGVNAAF